MRGDIRKRRGDAEVGEDSLAATVGPTSQLRTCQVVAILILITQGVKAQESKPVIQPMDNMPLVVGQPMTLVCEYTINTSATPTPSLTWQRNGVAVSPGEYRQEQSGGGVEDAQNGTATFQSFLTVDPLTVEAVREQFICSVGGDSFVHFVPFPKKEDAERPSTERDPVSVLGPRFLRAGETSVFECSQPVSEYDDVPQLRWRFGNSTTAATTVVPERTDLVTYESTSGGELIATYTAQSRLTLRVTEGGIDSITLSCHSVFTTGPRGTSAQLRATVVKRLKRQGQTTHQCRHDCSPGVCRDGSCDCRQTKFVGKACEDKLEVIDEDAAQSMALGVGLFCAFLTVAGTAFVAVYMYREWKADQLKTRTDPMAGGVGAPPPAGTTPAPPAAASAEAAPAEAGVAVQEGQPAADPDAPPAEGAQPPPQDPAGIGADAVNTAVDNANPAPANPPPANLPPANPPPANPPPANPPPKP